VVYGARDARLDRQVAVKVLPAALAEDAASLARFEREAKAVAALSHPNILAVHDVGRADGTSYAVMELLEGESLRQRLAAGPLPPRKALEIAREVALGLAAAHEKGIVHRDLKPENLFLTRDGRVKILDFGLARSMDLVARDDTQSPTSPQLSEPGAVLGTVGYMSPEQVRGRVADHRSDVFSFGAVLYEMLTGERAFRGETAVETMNAILKDDPPELARPGGRLPGALERVVGHCLEKQPEERFQSARDLAFDLATAASGTSAAGEIRATDAAPPRRRRAVLYAGAAVLALAAAAWAGARLAAPGAAGPVTFRRLTFRRGNLLSARFAPDGQTVVYSAAWEGKPAALYSVRTDSVETRSLGLEHASVLSVSPQGELAVKMRDGSFQSDTALGTLARVPLGGGAPRQLLEDVFNASWTPGGETLAVIRQTPDGKTRLEWPAGNLIRESFFVGSNVGVSPSGDRVAFSEVDNKGERTIYTADRSGKVEAVSRGWKRLGRLVWSRKSGEILFIGARQGQDAALHAVSRAGRERLLWNAPPGFILHDVAADGRVLLERATTRIGVIWKASDAAPERELGWLDGTEAVRLSSDGKTLVFDEMGEGAGPRKGVYVRPTDGGPAVRLGDGMPQDLSPDGKWVVAITQSVPPEVVLLPTGPGSPRKVPTPGLAPILAFMLGDARRILVMSSAPDKPWEAYFVSVDGGAPKHANVKDVNWAGEGAFTEDGRLFGYSTTDRRIWLETGLGTTPTEIPGARLAEDEILRVFTPDRRAILSQTISQVPAKIYRTDLRTGEKTLWKEVAPADQTGVIGINEVLFARDLTAYAFTYHRVETSDLYVVEGLR
jgi:hypothetical protein